MTPEEIIVDPGCLTLPEDMIDERDFKAEEAINLNLSVKLPESFSLGEWIWITNYQGSIGSCTSNSTSHGVQVLNVKKEGKKPEGKNIITPNWKDLRKKMGHNPEKYEGGDYIEKAVSTALKEGIKTEEGGEARFEGYSYLGWSGKNEDIEKMKRYLYNGNPIIWQMRGDKSVWNQLSAGQLKTGINPAKATGGHAICLVGWDKQGFRFINSWFKNDEEKRKSRFHVPYSVLKEWWNMFNFRMWILYAKEDAKNDPEYLKRKATALVVLKALRKIYPEESTSVKQAIEFLSSALRGDYPELNDELPLNN